MFLLQKWPDAFSPDLAISQNSQSDSVSELERQKEGTLGSPVVRDTHCPPERRIHHRFVLRCSAAVLRRDALGRALWISTCGYLIHSIRVGASSDRAVVNR